MIVRDIDLWDNSTKKFVNAGNLTDLTFFIFLQFRQKTHFTNNENLTKNQQIRLAHQLLIRLIVELANSIHFLH